jgi:O-antigen/teichoic acid export membrane protein
VEEPTQPSQGMLRSLLKKAGDKTGIDIFTTIRNGSFTLGRQVVAFLVAIILNILYSHLLSKETFGQFNLVLAMVGVVSILTLPSLNSAILKSVARGHEGFYFYALRASFLGGVVTSLLLIAGMYLNVPVLNRIDHTSLTLAAVFLPFYFGLNAWESFLMGRGNFKLSSLLGSVQTLVVGAGMAGILFWQPTLVWLIVGLMGITSLTNTFYAWLTWRSAQSEEGNVREYMLMGVNLSWIGFLPSISSYIEKVIIGLFLGPAQLAEYVIAALLPDALKTVVNTVLSTFTPKIAARSTKQTMAMLRHNRLILWGSGFVAAVVSVVAAPVLIPFAFGPQYAHIVHLAQILSIVLLVMPMNNVLHTIAIFEGKVALNTSITTIPTLVRFALYPFILPAYGLVGYALSLLAGEIFFMTMTFYLLGKEAAAAT